MLQLRWYQFKYKKLEVMQARTKNKSNFQVVNKPSRISPHEVVQPQLIKFIIYY